MSDLTRHVASLRHLKKDKRFAALIKKHGAPDLSRYHGTMKVFSSLLRSITFQQLSGHASRAIHGRFLALFPKSGPTPHLVLKVPTGKLRATGLSASKVLYMRDLAKKFKDGTINEKKFPKMTSQEIIDHLVQVKGIGAWTAHMLLIFTLHRPDILPTGDLGVRKGFQKVYKLKELPSPKEMEHLAKDWREHASVASWYLWRVADEYKK